MRKRIAIWLHGGLGTGHFDQGYPMLERLIEGLADSFELIVYSQTAPNPGYRNTRIIIRTASRRVSNGLFRWVILVWLFLGDHLNKRFDQLFAFWGWPTGWIVVVLGQLLGRPGVIYLLGGDAAGIAAINYGILHRPLKRKLAMWAYNRATLLLGISNYQSRQLATFGLKRTLVVISWGADDKIYTYNEREVGKVLHFIHVGHSSAVKDQPTLVRAFATISSHYPAELLILGIDSHDGSIRALCETLAIAERVRFMGMVPCKEMPSYYERADIMLHTSLSEGQCMALTEAAACGILMAGTPVGLLHDLGADCGIIADFGDHKSLAKQLLEILKNPEARQVKIRNAYRWSEQHTLGWTIRELTKQLNDL